MYFDVPKVVRSPGYDHGHDEESRNGRDIKIDILDNVIRTLDEFRGYRINIGVLGVIANPGGTNGPRWALVEREGAARAGRVPLPLQSELD